MGHNLRKPDGPKGFANRVSNRHNIRLEKQVVRPQERLRRFSGRGRPYPALHRPAFESSASLCRERTRDDVRVVLHTARPGLVIGPKGAEVDKLREVLEDLIDRKVTINIMEIKQPDLNAQLVAEAISEQLKRRAAFRRAMKQHCELTMAAGAKGVKIIVSGRLAGAEPRRLLGGLCRLFLGSGPSRPAGLAGRRS